MSPIAVGAGVRGRLLLEAARARAARGAMSARSWAVPGKGQDEIAFQPLVGLMLLRVGARCSALPGVARPSASPSCHASGRGPSDAGGVAVRALWPSLAEALAEARRFNLGALTVPAAGSGVP